ncbi:MAG: cobaltochelatase subunit CobN, partial [Pseudomonadota bacterium]
MHLLAAQPGTVSDGSEPVDPGQDPADVIFISAADTELAALAEARATLGDEAPVLRLANLAWLAHPFSVDLYLEKTALRSKLVIVRILGGAAYWSYGLEQFAIRLGEAGVPFAALPGDDKPDEDLFALSTVPRAVWEGLLAYCVEGGPRNAANLLRQAQYLLGRAEEPPAAEPLLRAGTYWPGAEATGLATLRDQWTEGAPVAAIVFYRALVQGAGLHPINRLIRALLRRGLNPLPVYVASLKDPVSAATLAQLFAGAPPDIVLNATAFAVGSADPAKARSGTPLDAPGRPVLQVVLSGGSEEAWEASDRGLSARDIAMNVALPEVDGRILSRAISFKGEAYRDEATQCSIAAYRAVGDRVEFVADLAANWTRLARTPAAQRQVALVLANYPNKDGRLANGVGLDTPAATVAVLEALAAAGYAAHDIPADSAALMEAILAGPTNWLTDRAQRTGGVRLPLATYRAAYARLPLATRRTIEDRWGAPEDDPFVIDDAFALSVLRYGAVTVGIQPARGYNIEPAETYHAPDLAPPHNYLAFYIWLREVQGAQAIVHMGKHGNLEWLPGKAVALSESCLPEAVLGPVPHLYPFIVNDPGEGTQAKRRAQAVIIDHLTPPLTRAETYGPLRDLEVLVDEYYQAAGVDPRRITHLRGEILSLMAATGLDADAGASAEEDADSRLAKLDAYLCELKESQIRDGLHIFGRSPQGRLATDLTVALARVPRGAGQGGDASLIRALAADLGLADFDPLDCPMAEPWTGPKPSALAELTADPWRSNGDTVERLEVLAARLTADLLSIFEPKISPPEAPTVATGTSADQALATSATGGGGGGGGATARQGKSRGPNRVPGPASGAVLATIRDAIAPALAESGPAELAGLLAGLE